MERRPNPERPGWRDKAEAQGFLYHTDEFGAYWVEDAHYAFTLRQIENELEDPATELHEMCLELVDQATQNERMMGWLRIPEAHWDYVRNSWLDRQPGLYGRFDFAYDGQGRAKLLEYNADTPTSLFETGCFQWEWLEDQIEAGVLADDVDQFNGAHEALIERLRAIGGPEIFHIAGSMESDEDRGNCDYLLDCAHQAGLDAAMLDMAQIGVDEAGRLLDADDRVIETLFKLYPWEWIWEDEFAAHLVGCGARLIEPPWKALLSNKAILPLLWDAHPNHPNLLPAYFEGDQRAAKLTDYAKKPIFSREGANITLFKDGAPLEEESGPYGEEGAIIQALAPLPDFEGWRPVCGVWVIGDNACAMGMREDRSAITNNRSRFVPHVII